MPGMGTTVDPIMTFIGEPGVYSHKMQDVLPAETQQDKSDVQVMLLDRKHPTYESCYEAWLDLSLLYAGGAALKTRCERLLKKRPREDEEVYSARMDRFTYQNILATALGWYGAAMFGIEPEIFFDGKSPEDFYDKFLQNCDGTGTAFIDFFKRVFQMMLTYGAGWVLTDLKALEADDPPPLTRADELARGLLDPHLVAYTPLNVINWQSDELGNLKWAVVRTEEQQQDFLSDPVIVTTWYYYDRNDYRVYEWRRTPEEQVKIATQDTSAKAKFLRAGSHALSGVSKVPIRRLELNDGLWLANRAYLLLIDHLNQDNTLAWSLFMSNLAIPIVIGDVDANQMTMSETGYLQFPTGTTYTWSEPGGKSFDQSAKRVDSLREECFRSMNLQAQGRSMHATPAMQSGLSKTVEMMPAKQVLGGMGDSLRMGMQSVLEDVKDARRDVNEKPDVRGFTFQDDMTTEEVFAVTSVLGMRIPSKKFEKYLQKRVAKTWMQDANREELTDVYGEIESGPTMEEQQEKDMKNKIGAARQMAGNSLVKAPGRGGDGPSMKSNSSDSDTPQI